MNFFSACAVQDKNGTFYCICWYGLKEEKKCVDAYKLDKKNH